MVPLTQLSSTSRMSGFMRGGGGPRGLTRTRDRASGVVAHLILSFGAPCTGDRTDWGESGTLSLWFPSGANVAAEEAAEAGRGVGIALAGRPITRGREVVTFGECERDECSPMAGDRGKEECEVMGESESQVCCVGCG